jgi:hypothetical protein
VTNIIEARPTAAGDSGLRTVAWIGARFWGGYFGSCGVLTDLFLPRIDFDMTPLVFI